MAQQITVTLPRHLGGVTRTVSVYGAMVYGNGNVIIVTEWIWRSHEVNPAWTGTSTQWAEAMRPYTVKGMPSYGWNEVWGGPHWRDWLAAAQVGEARTFGRGKLTKIDPSTLPVAIEVTGDRVSF